MGIGYTTGVSFASNSSGEMRNAFPRANTRAQVYGLSSVMERGRLEASLGGLRLLGVLLLVLGLCPTVGLGQERAGALVAPPSSSAPVQTNQADARELPTVADASSASSATLPDAGVPAADAMRAVVVKATVLGVDPVVADHVTYRLAETAKAMGYALSDAADVSTAISRVGAAPPVTPANLWRVTYAAGAQRGVTAQVSAGAGVYVIEVTAASVDGAGPFFARGQSGATDLHETVERLTREALPVPATFRPDEAARIRAEAERMQPAPPGAPPGTIRLGRGAALPDADEEFEEPPMTTHLRLAIQTEGAIGTSDSGFYNHFLGTRLEYHLTRELLLGIYGGYANLKGRDGRAHNFVSYLQFEDRVRVGAGTDIAIPLRAGFGYLMRNGPILRLAAGVMFPLGDFAQLGIEVLAPTFWILPDRTLVSLNFSAELVIPLF